MVKELGYVVGAKLRPLDNNASSCTLRMEEDKL